MKSYIVPFSKKLSLIIVLQFLFCLFFIKTITAQQYQLASPDGHLRIQVNNSDSLCFSIQKDGDSIVVKSEQFDVHFPQGATAWFSLLKEGNNTQDRWVNNYEHVYEIMAINKLSSRRTQLPLLIDLQQKEKILIAESNLYDYPGLHFTGGADNSLQALFPPRRRTAHKSLKEGDKESRIAQPVNKYPYIAKTNV